MSTTATTPASGDALYLYAVVPAAACAVIRASLSDEFRVIERASFAVVARPTFERSLAGRDRRELVGQLLAHQEVVEAIMARAPVLPVKFATVAPDGESVGRCLETGAAEFAETFERLADRIQYEVLVTWDLKQVFAEVAKTPEIARLRSESMAGDVDQAAAIRLGAAVKDMLEERRSETAGTLARAFRTMTQDAIENALMDDQMVLNMALLIDRGGAAALDRCLETLDATYAGGLHFRCVGPLPPHSFATVEASFFDADKLSWARQLLQLGGATKIEDVRAAYHRLAKRVHPDATGEETGADGMAALHDAYRTLCAYAETGGPVQVSVCRQQPASAGTPGQG